MSTEFEQKEITDSRIVNKLVGPGLVYIGGFDFNPDPPLTHVRMELAHLGARAVIITAQSQTFKQGWVKLIWHIYGEVDSLTVPSEILDQIPPKGKFLTNKPDGSFVICFEFLCRAEKERQGIIEQSVAAVKEFLNANLAVLRQGRFKHTVAVGTVPLMTREAAKIKRLGLEVQAFSDAWLNRQLPDELPIEQLKKVLELADWRGWKFELGQPMFA